MIRRANLSLFMIWFLAPPRLVDAREVRIALSCQMAPIFYRNRGGWQGLGVEIASVVPERFEPGGVTTLPFDQRAYGKIFAT